MGDEKQFRHMVTACRKAGVKVYVDAVINHTTGQGSTSYGGKTYTPVHLPRRGLRAGRLPRQGRRVPLAATAGSQDFNNKTAGLQLQPRRAARTCAPRRRRCSGTLAAYLNKLIGYGVSGFRVDAGKHIAPADLDAIYAQLDKTKDGKSPTGRSRSVRAARAC